MVNSLEKIVFWLIIGLVGLTLLIPLFVDNSFFFPYVYPKSMAFKLLVEVMVVAYAFLVYLNPAYRPKLNWLTAMLAGFIGVAFLSSALGPDFYGSFWGDIERSEGLLLWLHLLVYFLILNSVVQQQRFWHYLLDFNLGVGIVVSGLAISQIFGLMVSSGGSRVSAMMGNAAFLAGYLVFDLALAVYFILIRKNSWLRGYYGSLAILFFYVIVKTQTRGAFLGVMVALFLASLVLIFNQKINKKIRYASIGLIVFLLLCSSVLFLNREAKWLKNYPMLSRMASISLEETTSRNRLVTWEVAYRGWTADSKIFLIGAGLENFTEIFDRNFPAIIYEDPGSQVWFDRAHNVIFDRAVSTGLIGLGLYLLFIFLPFLPLIKDYRDGNRSALALACLIVAFFVQDLFVFETITTYIILIFTWAFLAQYFKQYQPNLLFGVKKFWLGVSVFLLFALYPLFQQVIYYPNLANREAAKATHIDVKEENYYIGIEQFNKAIALGTYGKNEYRLEYIQFVDNILANLGQLKEDVWPSLEAADLQAIEQVKAEPNTAVNYLLAMRHFNYTYQAIPAKVEERLKLALSYYPRAAELSPTRPQVHQEAGYSHEYLMRLYNELGRTEEAKEQGRLAEELFLKTISLRPELLEFHHNLLNLYLQQNDTEKIKARLLEMEQKGIDYKIEDYLARLAQKSAENKSYESLILFTDIQLELDPNNVDYYNNKAMALAYLDIREQAIETINQIKKLPNSGQYDSLIKRFIEEVNKGTFVQ